MPHEYTHVLVTARVIALLTERPIDARRTVFAFEGGLHALDQCGERVASSAHGRGGTLQLGVVSRQRHPQRNFEFTGFVSIKLHLNFSSSKYSTEIVQGQVNVVMSVTLGVKM